MSIGTRIRQVREKRGFTQKFMADALQMSQANYHKTESGKNNKIDAYLLIKIARLLGVNTNQLLPDDELPEPETPEMAFPSLQEVREQLKIYKQIFEIQEEFLMDKEKINQLLLEKVAHLEAEIARLRESVA